MPPLDSARMHLMVAYTVNSLFWMYLRTQGADVQNHPVRKELERVKKAMRKVKEAEAKAETSTGDSLEARQAGAEITLVASRWVAGMPIIVYAASGRSAGTRWPAPLTVT